MFDTALHRSGLRVNGGRWFCPQTFRHQRQSMQVRFSLVCRPSRAKSKSTGWLSMASKAIGFRAERKRQRHAEYLLPVCHANGNTIADTGTAHFFPRQDSSKTT